MKNQSNTTVGISLFVVSDFAFARGGSGGGGLGLIFGIVIAVVIMIAVFKKK